MNAGNALQSRPEQPAATVPTDQFGSPKLSQRFFHSMKKYHYSQLKGQPMPLLKTLELFGKETEPFLRGELQKMGAMKVSLIATVLYQSARPDAPPPPPDTKQHLRSRRLKVFLADDLSERYEVIKNDVLERNANYVKDKSGLILYAILSLDYEIDKYAPLAGSAYVPLPLKLARKKAIINVQNTDNRCFAYAVCAARHPVESQC